MDIGWKIASAASLAVAGIVADKTVDVIWKAATGHKPPRDGDESGQAGILEIAIFGVVSGLLVAIIQHFALGRANKWYGGKNRDMLAEKQAETEAKEAKKLAKKAKKAA